MLRTHWSILWLWSSFFIFGFSLPAAASTADFLKKALVSYTQGKYAETLDALAQIQGDRDTKATVDYWKGHCQFKLKEYDKAILSFRAAIAGGSKNNDQFFVLGQSYFASQKLEEAIPYFEKSAEVNFKRGASYYYVGYIYQILDRRRSATDMYAKVMALPKDADKVKQASLFQVAEMKYSTFQERVETLKQENKLVGLARLNALEKNILPYYELARDYETGTQSHDEAKAKILEIEKFLVKSKPKAFLTARATMEFSYDSNVITKADESVSSISQKDSFIVKPTIRLNNMTNLGGKWSLDSGLRTAMKLHSRRGIQDVFKNDNITIEPSFNLERQNMLFSEPGELFFLYEWNYQFQDYKKQHKISYYSRSHNFEIGQRASPFAIGQTSLKANFKFYENYDPGSNSLQPGAEINQKTKIAGRSLSTTIGVDWLFARKNTNDTITYKFNNRYPIELGNEYNLTPKFNFSVLDSQKSYATRGMERKFAPGIALRKTMEKGGIWRLSYDFTRNLSKDKANQQYRRHEVAISYEHRF